MVISAENPRPPPDPIVATTVAQPPVRTETTQSHLHNFSFPILKRWGCQRVLRCLNVNRKGEIIRSPRPAAASRSAAVADEQLEQVRKKLLVQLREAEDRVKVPETTVGSPPRELVPWNLRTRRTPVKDQTSSGSHDEKGAAAPVSSEAAVTATPHVRTVRLRSEDVEKRERPRFSITLTRDEIDEDFYAVTGSTARRRPKKRPRSVQKQLDMLFPGSWLSEVTADSYKVPD